MRPAMARRCVARQVRSRGSTHNFLNWHNLDYHTESYHSLTQASMYDNENRVYNIRKSIHKWDSHLSPLMYGGSFTVAEPSVSAPMPFWINEHLFARTYWNTNLNLYYWENFHLSFYYIERLRLPLKQVFSNNFVFTPRWAYNLVLLYTKNPTWDFVDIGLRMKTMLYVNSHVWLVFKFKMHKVARLNGIERGIRNREESTDPLHDKKPGNKMSNQENLNHYVMDDDAHDHRQEGAGAAHHRNYAHVSTMAGPEFAREHTKGRPWWWHAYPAKRRRWDASNPFGHDMKQGYDATSSMPMRHVPGGLFEVRLDRDAMSNW
ncbi:hypothetical protein DIPPA_26551 [Diplonema papillatum]|nr:hypothetical protein DIPPA_26551 [Diplonema papillatum]